MVEMRMSKQITNDSENYKFAVEYLKSSGFIFRDHGGYILDLNFKSEIVVGWTSENNEELRICIRVWETENWDMESEIYFSSNTEDIKTILSMLIFAIKFYELVLPSKQFA